ncbi:hypothetical protein ACF1BE_04320 [Streptomyces sp. NPDC014991]|uniref:hypothetical protein n=1 Tax=Streptomyces sp. NPDC014991 TaxID=3364935 RepID=UPI0036FC16C4
MVDARHSGAFLAPLFAGHTKCRDLVSGTLGEYEGETVGPPELRRSLKQTAPAALPRRGPRAGTRVARAGIRRKQAAAEVIQAAGSRQEGIEPVR